VARAAEPLAGSAALPEPTALWTNLEQVVGLGKRFVGTVGEKHCCELLLEEFERAELSRVRAGGVHIVGI
jgi:hypothetical protein